MLRRVLYTSRASESVTLKDVYEIIRVANNRNSEAGLTGGLIYLDGHFVQLLEGLPSAVEACLARIDKDQRHSEIVFRLDERTHAPLFPTDWMALRDASQVDRQTLLDHHYEVGMNASRFSGLDVLNLLLACFKKDLVGAPTALRTKSPRANRDAATDQPSQNSRPDLRAMGRNREVISSMR